MFQWHIFNVWCKIQNLHRFLAFSQQIERRLFNTNVQKYMQIFPFKIGDMITLWENGSRSFLWLCVFSIAFYCISSERTFLFDTFRFIVFIYLFQHTHISRVPLPFSLIHRVVLPAIFGPIDRLNSHIKLVYFATCLSIGRVRLLSSAFDVKRAQNYARWLPLDVTGRVVLAWNRNASSTGREHIREAQLCYPRYPPIIRVDARMLTRLPLAYEVSQSRSFRWRRRRTRTWSLINTLLF